MSSHDDNVDAGVVSHDPVECNESPVIEGSDEERLGTTASARFNILATMVGGGSLSLPLAFQKSGNAFTGPFLLILTAVITEFCFRVHVNSARIASPVSASATTRGNDSFERITAIAFGKQANVFSMFLVTAMCFFGTVGYAVLLRDMLQPITDYLWHTSLPPGPDARNNASMWAVVLAVTPLCTMQTLTALKPFGAASMMSVLILGSCIVYRALQCNLGPPSDAAKEHDLPTFQFFPNSAKDVLDVFPLYVSCFVCHYNLLPVHNELRNPTAKRVSWWLRSTVWVACLFYLIMGMAGSAYGHCTATGHVHGNILLDFDAHDPLLFVGRMCLALTITLAFPMLTIPGRDIVIRSMWQKQAGAEPTSALPRTSTEHDDPLHEPLLDNDHLDAVEGPESSSQDSHVDHVEASLGLRLGMAVLVLWSAAAVASCVQSIDVVWDLLGSSLSILLSYLIPCGAFLVIVATYVDEDDEEAGDLISKRWSTRVSWFLIVVFVPLMIVSTANAVIDTFFSIPDDTTNTTWTSH